MLKRKPQIEEHKSLAESRLAARLEILKSKGMTSAQMKKDSEIKHYKAVMRQARHQLTQIEKMETQITQKAEIKAKKLAAPKIDPPKHKRSDPDPMKKRIKKDKKTAAETAATAE